MCFWFTDLFISMDLAIKISPIDICFPVIIVRTALYLKDVYTACLTSLMSSINCQRWITIVSIKLSCLISCGFTQHKHTELFFMQLPGYSWRYSAETRVSGYFITSDAAARVWLKTFSWNLCFWLFYNFREHFTSYSENITLNTEGEIEGK